MPKEIRLRCQFLWSSAMQCADASPPQPRTAQKLLHNLRQLTAAHDCRVPDSLTKTLCPKCWAPRIPGVSCRTRTAKRTRRSPASMRYVVDKKSGGHALKSQLVTTCLLCGEIARAPGAPRPPARPPKKRDMRAAADDFVAVGAPLLPRARRSGRRRPPRRSPGSCWTRSRASGRRRISLRSEVCLRAFGNRRLAG